MTMVLGPNGPLGGAIEHRRRRDCCGAEWTALDGIGPGLSGAVPLGCVGSMSLRRTRGIRGRGTALERCYPHAPRREELAR